MPQATTPDQPLCVRCNHYDGGQCSLLLTHLATSPDAIVTDCSEVDIPTSAEFPQSEE